MLPSPPPSGGFLGPWITTAQPRLKGLILPSLRLSLGFPNPPDLWHFWEGEQHGGGVPCAQRAGSSGHHEWHDPAVGPRTLVPVPAPLKIPGRKTTPRGAVPGIYLALQAPSTQGPGCKSGDVWPPVPRGRSGVPSPPRWSRMFFRGASLRVATWPQAPAPSPLGTPWGGPGGGAAPPGLPWPLPAVGRGAGSAQVAHRLHHDHPAAAGEEGMCCGVWGVPGGSR